MKHKETEQGTRSLRAQFSDMEVSDHLSSLILSTSDEWDRAKHPGITEGYAGFLDTLTPEACPFCGCADFRKDGRDSNRQQRFRCNGCEKRFRVLTGTVFDSAKIPMTEWVEFLIHLFQYQSVLVSSIDNRNAKSTGLYWLRKVFCVLDGYQDGIMLGEKVWVDETYLPKMPKDTVIKDGDRLRGLSRNKLCIITATDKDRIVVIPNGTGKPSGDKMVESLKNHIRKGSTVIDDGERSHGVLCESLGLNRISHSTVETHGLSDEDNPLEPINRIHCYFKKFMQSHGSYDRDRIQDWCNLFAFIWNHHGDIPSMVKDMLEMSISCKNVIRYRSELGKKP